MIHQFESKYYRIEEVHNTPCRWALDYKQRDAQHVHLINLGWFNCYEHALRAMNQHYLTHVYQTPG